MKSFVALFAFFALFASSTNSAPATQSDFAIPGHGTLHLPLPDGWKVQQNPLADPPSVFLHLTPPFGDSFDMQITAVWLAPDKLAEATPASLRANVQKAGESLLVQAVEKSLTIRELKGAQTVGYYYALTDRDPGAGFPQITQGTILIGEALVPFTLLHRSPSAPEATQALAALTTATYSK